MSAFRSRRKAIAVLTAGMIINPAFAAVPTPNTYVDLPVPQLTGWNDVNTFTIDGISGATSKTLIYPDANVKATAGAATGDWDEDLAVGLIYWELDNGSGRAPGIQVVTDDFDFPVNNCIMASGEIESTDFPGTILPKTCSDSEGSSKRYFMEITQADEPVDLVFDLGIKDIRYKGVKDPADDGGEALAEFRETYGIGRIYRVIQKIINNTDTRVASYKFELGTGVGDDFAAVTFADDGVAFEMRSLVPREFFEGETGAPDVSVWNPQRFITFSPKMFDDGSRPRFDPGFLDHATAGFLNPQDIEAGEKSQYIGTGPNGDIPGSLTGNYFDMASNQATGAGLTGNVFGHMLPDSLIPTVIGQYSTNEIGGESDAIVAWWDGDNWRYGLDDSFAIIPDSELEQWAAKPLGLDIPGEDPATLVRYASLLSDDLSAMNTDMFIYISDKLMDENGDLTLDSITLRVTAVSVDAAGLGADAGSLDPTWVQPGKEAPSLSSYAVDTGVPVAINDAATTEETDPVTIDVVANDLLDGAALDPLDVVSVQVTVDPVNGDAVVNVDNTITYTADAAYVGTEVFKYTVTINDGVDDIVSNEASIKVTVEAAPVPDAPVAANDSATTFESTAVTVDVLENDQLNIDAPTTVLVEVVDAALNGNAVVDGENNIAYTPNDSFVGFDRFTYRVTVDGKVSNTALITIRVDEPVIDEPKKKSSSGCSVGNANGPFDPMLPGMLLLALMGLFLRRRRTA